MSAQGIAFLFLAFGIIVIAVTMFVLFKEIVHTQNAVERILDHLNRSKT